MKLEVTISLTPAQMEALAGAVAEKLANRPGKVRRETLSIREAAEMLGVSGLTVRRRIAAGILPRVEHLSSVRIPTAAVERLIGSNG